MITTILLIALAAAPHPPPPADDFSGTWEVVRVVDREKGAPWSSLEIKYPKRFTLRREGAVLSGSYVDQFDYANSFELVAVVNKGRDLLLVHGGEGTKAAEALSPIHHVKLVKGRLHAVVMTNIKCFEWIAERK
jgi:hypothetical protein